MYTRGYRSTAWNPSPPMSSWISPFHLHCRDIKHIILFWLNASKIKFHLPICGTRKGPLPYGKGECGNRGETPSGHSWACHFLLDKMNFSFPWHKSQHLLCLYLPDILTGVAIFKALLWSNIWTVSSEQSIKRCGGGRERLCFWSFRVIIIF